VYDTRGDDDTRNRTGVLTVDVKVFTRGRDISASTNQPHDYLKVDQIFGIAKDTIAIAMNLP
jgi:hypothetical protein